MISTIVWAIVVGTVLGYVGKLLLPGKQNIPWWSTIGAGIVAALLAGFVADWLGWRHTSGIDWLYHLLQIVFAVLAIWVVAGIFGRRRGRASYNR
jgi:uncharacterized membrane protein YeaQ/YmgE (transglycosylase-associated protein family)